MGSGLLLLLQLSLYCALVTRHAERSRGISSRHSAQFPLMFPDSFYRALDSKSMIRCSMSRRRLRNADSMSTPSASAC